MQEELSSLDVNKITEGLLKKLNKVADILAPAKRVQLKKNEHLTKDPEVKEMYEEAGKTKTEAINTGDPELFQKARTTVFKANL